MPLLIAAGVPNLRGHCVKNVEQDGLSIVIYLVSLAQGNLQKNSHQTSVRFCRSAWARARCLRAARAPWCTTATPRSWPSAPSNSTSSTRSGGARHAEIWFPVWFHLKSIALWQYCPIAFCILHRVSHQLRDLGFVY